MIIHIKQMNVLHRQVRNNFGVFLSRMFKILYFPIVSFLVIEQTFTERNVYSFSCRV